MGQRYTQSEDGTRGQFLTEINQCIAELFRGLGLPAVQAPGEAEAMCAALQRKGIVTACATKDSDALIFGATMVLHTIALQVTQFFETPNVGSHYENLPGFCSCVT